MYRHLVICVNIYQQVSRESFTCPKCKVLTETALRTKGEGVTRNLSALKDEQYSRI